MDANNYSLIAIASGASEINEKSLLVGLENAILISYSKFEFKEYQSPELSVFAVEETIHYYRNLGAPMFACFLDVVCAFNRVYHSRLF